MTSYIKLIAFILLFTSTSVHSADKKEYQLIEWQELMSEEDLAAIEAMPAIDHGDEYSNLDDQPVEYNWEDESWDDESWDTDTSNDTNEISSDVANAISNAIMIRDQPDIAKAYDAALISTKVRPEFDKSNIRLAGFVVPLEFDDNQIIKEFFLVPYFGACIHLPPPPPNQIIHVTVDTAFINEGFRLEQLYEPVWVSGQLKTELLESSMATSAYSLSAHIIAPYSED